MIFTEDRHLNTIAENILICLCFLAVSFITYYLFSDIGLLPMPICPSAAVALTAACFLGLKSAPGIAAGTLLANYLILKSPLEFAGSVTVMNTLAPLLAGWLIRRHVNSKFHINNLCNLAYCFIIAVIFAPMLSAAGAIISKYLLGLLSVQDFAESYLKWSLAHSLGTLLFATPVFLYYINRNSDKISIGRFPFSPAYAKRCITLLTIIISIYFWLADALFEALWFPDSGKALSSYILPTHDLHELIMRLMFILAFIICGLSVYHIIIILLMQQKEVLTLAQDLSTTLNSIGDGVISTDEEGRITRINPVAQRLTGWSESEARGRRMDEVFVLKDKESGEIVPSPATEVISSKMMQSLGASTILIGRDGSEFRIADSAAPIIGSNGSLRGAILVFRDITEEYEMESRLKHSQRMDAIGQLAGGVAHDFNNMLGGIIGFSELLGKKVKDDPEASAFVEMIIDTSDKAASLTRKLLAFARKNNIPSTSVDIHTIIYDSTELLKRTIDKRINVITRLNAEKFSVVGDPSQLQNIFINMGINSAYAMEDGGDITITTRNRILTGNSTRSNGESFNPGEYIEIRIADTGCGIAKEAMPHIFEPFFTTRENDMGTGLGLSAVYGTVEQHKGDISVSSIPGTGTTFTILLPATAEEDTHKKTAPAQPEITGSGSILIADDEEIMRLTATRILENAGYTVTSAADGREALAIFREDPTRYNLVILDMIMPQMNGRDCFMEIRRLNADIRVILASGFSQEEDIRLITSKPLTHFITKPYRGIELLHAVHTALTEPDP